MELRAILEILWRRRRIILAVFISLFLTILLGSVLVQPSYDASAKVLLRKSPVASSVLSSLGMQGQSVGSASSLNDTDRSDYLALSTLRPVAEKVISRLQLKRLRTRARIMNAVPFLKALLKFTGVDVTDTEETISAEDLFKKSLMSNFFPRPYISVEQYESTDIISIEAYSTDPEEAGKMANAMASAFVDEELQRVREDFKDAKEYIQSNIKTYNHEYRKALRELRQFRKRERTVNLELEVSEYLKQISDLKQTQRELYLSLVETKTKYNPDHPAVIDLQNKIEETKRLIKQKMEVIFGTDAMVEDPELRKLAGLSENFAEKSTGASPVRSMNRDDLTYDDAMFRDLPQKSSRYAELSLAVSVTQDIYNSLLKSLYQVGIAEAISVANVYVVESAIAPSRTDSAHRHPSVIFNLVVAVFLGMFLGIASALVIEYIDDSLRTSDDLKSIKGLTYLGTVHKLRKNDMRLINENDPRSPLREAFRTIRNNIRFTVLDRKMKSYCITSSIQGEGKSFFASNIAISFANEGKKVLLIDGDMRRPNIHNYFGINNTTGLTSYLVGDRSVDDICVKTPVDGLTIIPTGAIPPDPAKLVESKKMQQLIRAMEEVYDLVIIDCPPGFAVNDAVLLGGYTGEVMIIVESGRASRKHFPKVIEMFVNANVNILGVVLNKASETSVGYYYSYEYKQS